MRVLLVDDELELRALWREILEGLEFTVSVAGSVTEALGLLEDGARFDVAVVDWTLPDGVGSDVLRAIRKVDGSTAVIYASGLGPLLPATHGGDAVLDKPFKMRDLAATIRSFA